MNEIKKISITGAGTSAELEVGGRGSIQLTPLATAKVQYSISPDLGWADWGAGDVSTTTILAVGFIDKVRIVSTGDAEAAFIIER